MSAQVRSSTGRAPDCGSGDQGSTPCHLTPRERFHALLASQAIREADAIVLLTGDGMTRVPTALECARQGLAHRLLISGGVDAKPYAIAADEIRDYLVARGVNPDALIVDMASTNTRESADAVANACVRNVWQSILLVTSAYHMPRAVLSMISAEYYDWPVRVIPVPVDTSHNPWTADRLALLDIEAAKVAEYQAKGDVASYEAGIEYLLQWEAR